MTEKICTLLFLKRDDQVLLAMKKRGFGAGRFNGVGGKIDQGETVEEALVRECQEEISVTPKHYWQVAEHDFTQNESDNPWRMYVHVFLCDEWEDEPEESEEMAPKWFAASEIPYSQMWQGDLLWLPRVLNGEKVLGVFTFDAADNIRTQDIRTVESLPIRK